LTARALPEALRGATTRFAPSTTGYLHLGHAAHAQYVWGAARALDGRVLLRIEDHDQSRHRPEYEQAILDDLAWLGFEADETVPPQRERHARYVELARQLHDAELLYACDCSRKQIVERTGEQQGELRYDGHCRDRALPLEGEVTWRVRLPDDSVTFEDAWLGTLTQCPAYQCGDLAVRDRHGQWTYQFAVVADDWDQGVDLVVRGEDLIDSTARQILLARMLGRETPPAFAHHPVMVDEATGKKLSKRDRAHSLAEMRTEGMSAEEVLQRAAADTRVLKISSPE